MVDELISEAKAVIHKLQTEGPEDLFRQGTAVPRYERSLPKTAFG